MTQNNTLVSRSGAALHCWVIWGVLIGLWRGLLGGWLYLDGKDEEGFVLLLGLCLYSVVFLGGLYPGHNLTSSHLEHMYWNLH